MFVIVLNVLSTTLGSCDLAFNLLPNLSTARALELLAWSYLGPADLVTFS
jgi:hypothetical protein